MKKKAHKCCNYQKKCLYLWPRQLRKTGDIEKSYYALTRKYAKKAHTFLSS